MKNLFIASEVRSGSTFAAELLSYTIHDRTNHEFWDLSQEKYSSLNDDSNYKDIMDISEKIWINGVGFRCAKIMCNALSIISREASNNRFIDDYFFGENSYWIIIQRKDTLAQAVSLAYAQKDGLYHFYSEDFQNKAVVSMADVDRAVKSILLSDIYLQSFQTMPKNVIQWNYEDIVSNNLSFVNDVLEKTKIGCGKDAHVHPVKLRKTASDEKIITKQKFQQWLVQNFHAT